VDLNTVVIGVDGPAVEVYYDDDDRKRGQHLERKLQLVGGRLSEAEAEELLALQRERPKTVARYILDALFRQRRQDEDPIEEMEGLRRGALGQRILSAAGPGEPLPPIPLTPGQCDMILRAGQPIWSSLVRTQVFVALKGDEALAAKVGTW